MLKGLRSITALILGCAALTAVAMPNPASTHCVQKGHKLVLIKNTGFCLFKDHSYCEEWAYMRGYCHKGKHKLPKHFKASDLTPYCVVKKKGQSILSECKLMK